MNKQQLRESVENTLGEHGIIYLATGEGAVKKRDQIISLIDQYVKELIGEDEELPQGKLYYLMDGALIERDNDLKSKMRKAAGL